MNIDQLRYFQLAYQERNFSAAARKAPVSHQGLTKSIRTLEKELGVTLFTPDPETGMPVSTHYADKLYDYATMLEEKERALKSELALMSTEKPMTIHIATSLGVMGPFGPSFLDRFHETCPQATVEYAESIDDVVEQSLTKGDASLAIVVTPCSAERCVSTDLYRSPMYFWVKRDDPLAERHLQGETLTVKDLEGYDIAIPGKGFKCCEQLKNRAAENDVELGRIIDMKEIFYIYGAASRGAAIGFSNGTLIDLPVFKSDPTLVPVPFSDLSWGFAIERLNTHTPPTVEYDFWNWCVQEAKLLPHNELA